MTTPQPDTRPRLLHACTAVARTPALRALGLLLIDERSEVAEAWTRGYEPVEVYEVPFLHRPGESRRLDVHPPLALGRIRFAVEGHLAAALAQGLGTDTVAQALIRLRGGLSQETLHHFPTLTTVNALLASEGDLLMKPVTPWSLRRVLQAAATRLAHPGMTPGVLAGELRVPDRPLEHPLDELDAAWAASTDAASLTGWLASRGGKGAGRTMEAALSACELQEGEWSPLIRSRVSMAAALVLGGNELVFTVATLRGA